MSIGGPDEVLGFTAAGTIEQHPVGVVGLLDGRYRIPVCGGGFVIGFAAAVGDNDRIGVV